MVKNVFNWVIRLLIAYVIVGSVYFLSGYFYNLSIGKENVFSPVLGYPLAVIGWPLSLHADFIHRASLGVKLSFPLTLLSIVLVGIWFDWYLVKKQNLENFYHRRKRTGYYEIFSFGSGFALYMEPTQQAAGYSASQNKRISKSLII